MSEKNHNALEAAAKQWMDEHPQAMELFQRFANRAVEAKRKIGIGLLTERIRWEYSIERRDGDLFKINNNHRAYIARRLIEQNPALKDYIETRSIKDDWTEPEERERIAWGNPE